MIELVDSHCHLADPKLRPQVDAIIARAAAAGVTRIVAVGAIGSIETDRATVAIAERHRDVYAVIGVHPHDARDCDDARVAALAELAKAPKVVGIGETGMDLHYNFSPPEAQERSLRRHLRLAHELGLPVVIHCREAEAQIARTIREEGLPAAGGVIHCFTGDAAAAVRFVELGLYLSFSGILTFRNAAALREAAIVVPAERLMVETDAPYLAPEPNRGKPNEPAFVSLTLTRLAALRKTETSDLAKITSANAERLFGLAA